MGKIEIKKKECKLGRSKVFGKRHRGLLKKAYELSVLCGVDVAVIMYSPGDVLRQFSSHPRLEKILQRFVQNIPKMPQNERENLQISQDVIDRINLVAGPANVEDQKGPDAPEEEEINPEIVDLQKKLMLLKEQQKMLDPGVETFVSEQQFEEHIQRLENIRSIIANKRHQNEYERSSRVPCTNPLQSVQIKTEPVMWDPVYGGERLPQLGVQFVGNGDPSSSSNPAPLFTWEQSVGACQSMPDLETYNFAMQGQLPGGQQEQVWKHRSIGDPCSSSYSLSNPYFIDQNAQHGMGFNGGVHQTVRQQSPASWSSVQIPTQHMQTGSEAGMWGLLHRGGQVQHPGVQFAGIDQDASYPPVFTGEQTTSVSSSMPNSARWEVAGPSNAHTWNPPIRGHQEQVQEHGTMQDPCSSAFPANNPFFNGEQNSMSGRMGSEATRHNAIQHNILAMPPGVHQEVNTQQEMPLYNGVQLTAGHRSSIMCDQLESTAPFEDRTLDEILQATEPNGTVLQNNRTF